MSSSADDYRIKKKNEVMKQRHGTVGSRQHQIYFRCVCARVHHLIEIDFY